MTTRTIPLTWRHVMQLANAAAERLYEAAKQGNNLGAEREALDDLRTILSAASFGASYKLVVEEIVEPAPTLDRLADRLVANIRTPLRGE